MADTTSYTHFDIDRYLKNKMTKPEMHDFEKAMMEDPFLADAIEGYQESDHEVASLHLAEIEKQILFKEEEKAKVVAMPSSKFAWWKIAAAVILIAGIGGISYNMFNTPSTSIEVASNKQKSAAAPVTDSIGPVQKPPANSQPFPESINEDVASNQTFSPDVKTREYNELAATSAAPVRKDSTMVAMNEPPTSLLQGRASGVTVMKAEEVETASIGDVARQYKPEARQPFVQREFKGRVLSPTGEPLGFATIQGKKDVGAVADANGNFSLRSPDSVLDVSVVVLGYGTVKAKLKSSAASNDIQLPETSMSLDEVVVTEISRKKNAAKSFDKNGVTNNSPGIEPEKGWGQFQRYMLESIQNIKDTSEAYLDGDVELEFSIDDEGHPQKIKVGKTINKLNADKAVELLQKGPKWKRNNKNERGKVVVTF